ncbi:hypothetical protein QUA86_34625 [Microcoleus sp. F6_B6]
MSSTIYTKLDELTLLRRVGLFSQIWVHLRWRSLPIGDRMGIEEMFRDYKSGGYYLEGTGLKGQRLMTLILLIALAYSSAIMQGTNLLHEIGQKVHCSPSRVTNKVCKTEYLWQWFR